MSFIDSYAQNIMEKFLRIVEKPSPSEINIDSDRLKVCNTKLQIWDYANVSFEEYQKFLLVIDQQSLETITQKCAIDVQVEVYFLLFFFVWSFSYFLCG